MNNNDLVEILKSIQELSAKSQSDGETTLELQMRLVQVNTLASFALKPSSTPKVASCSEEEHKAIIKILESPEYHALHGLKSYKPTCLINQKQDTTLVLSDDPETKNIEPAQWLKDHLFIYEMNKSKHSIALFSRDGFQYSHRLDKKIVTAIDTKSVRNVDNLPFVDICNWPPTGSKVKNIKGDPYYSVEAPSGTYNFPVDPFRISTKHSVEVDQYGHNYWVIKNNAYEGDLLLRCVYEDSVPEKKEKEMNISSPAIPGQQSVK